MPILTRVFYLTSRSIGASPRRQGEGQGPAGQGLRGRQGYGMHKSRCQDRRGRGYHRRRGGCQGVSRERDGGHIICYRDLFVISRDGGLALS